MQERHLDALARLEERCFSRPWSRQALAQELDNPNAVFLAAEDDRGAVLGYCGMHHAAGECYLDNLAVAPEARRQGIGSALLAAMEEKARALGGEFLSLEVRASNAGAIALYERAGFEPQGRRRDFYAAPREDAVIYTKRFCAC